VLLVDFLGPGSTINWEILRNIEKVKKND
jgi:hypothetical protein